MKRDRAADRAWLAAQFASSFGRYSVIRQISMGPVDMNLAVWIARWRARPPQFWTSA